MKHKFKHIQLLFITLSIVFSSISQAKQLDFTQAKNGNQTDLNYQWLDHSKKTQNLHFSVDNKTYYGQFRAFRRYRPDLAMRYVEVGLLKALPTISSNIATVRLKKLPQEIQIKVTGSDQAAVLEAKQQASQIQKDTIEQFLADNYYIKYTDSFGQTGIKPDHVRFTMESIPLFDSVAQKLYEKFKATPTRHIINYMLSFVQSIPYNTLENRIESHGAGYSPPNRLLYENQGDCDSKSVLMAALLRSIFSKMGVVIIYLPDHALVGFQIPYQKTDDYVKINGNYYVLAEPTGPAMMPVAKISKSSKRYIDGDGYGYEIVPPRRKRKKATNTAPTQTSE